MPNVFGGPRTKAERSMDELNRKLKELREAPQTKQVREQIMVVHQQLSAARRSIRQMREGSR